MSLDFAAKRKVIAQLTDPDNWENKFDPSFFEDERRRWRSESYNGISVSYDGNNPNTREILVIHHTSKAELFIQQQDIGFSITDERGVRVLSSVPRSEQRLNEKSKRQIIVEANDGQPDYCDPIGVPHLNIYVQFTDNGRKKITFENSDSFIELEAADEPIIKPLRNGRFVHANTVGIDFLGELAEFKRDPLTFVTIVTAKDLGLEVSLRSFNGLSFKGALPVITEALMHTEADTWNRLKGQTSNALKQLGGIATLEKPWRDSAEFNGYKAAVPRNFSISKQDDGFNFHTCSTGKERVLARGLLFSAATNSLSSTHTLPSTDMKKVISLLSEAETIDDRGNNPWHLIVVDHKGNFDGIRKLAEYAGERYHLTVDDFAVINTSKTQALIAIREDALDNALNSPKPLAIRTEPREESNVIRPQFGR